MALESRVIEALQNCLAQGQLLTAREDLIPYSFDGTAALRGAPGCVVMARSAADIVAVLRVASEFRVAVVTRGSGTGLSGGSVPSLDSIILCTVAMNRILEVDSANLTMLVEPGVTTLQVADAAAGV